MPFVCYIDEAGCAAVLPSGTSPIQPVFVLAALMVEHSEVAPLTRDFLKLKRKYFPGKFKSNHPLDDMRVEIKGSDVRSTIRKKGHAAKSSLKFLDEVLLLLKAHKAKLTASIWTKGIGVAIKPTAIYTRSIQVACHHFEAFLREHDDVGIVVADFRMPGLNEQVAHSVFTQKYRAKGDPFGRILELPTFGVSNNHVGLQCTDLLCSTLLFPMATSAYCHGFVRSVHVSKTDHLIRQRFKARVKALQFRYRVTGSPTRTRGGIWVSDKHAKRTSADMFL